MKVSVRFDKSRRKLTETARPRWHQWLMRGYDVKDDGLAELSTPASQSAVIPAVKAPVGKPEATASRTAQNCTFEVF
jgi:hypothetical protein